MATNISGVRGGATLIVKVTNLVEAREEKLIKRTGQPKNVMSLGMPFGDAGRRI